MAMARQAEIAVLVRPCRRLTNLVRVRRSGQYLGEQRVRIDGAEGDAVVRYLAGYIRCEILLIIQSLRDRIEVFTV